MNYNELLT